MKRVGIVGQIDCPNPEDNGRKDLFLCMMCDLFVDLEGTYVVCALPDNTQNGNSPQKEVCEFDKLNPPDNPEDEQRCKGEECNYCGKFGNSPQKGSE